MGKKERQGDIGRGLQPEAAVFFAAGFAFACAIGFALCAVAFFPVAGFALVVVFFVVVFFGPVFALTLAMIISFQL